MQELVLLWIRFKMAGPVTKAVVGLVAASILCMAGLTGYRHVMKPSEVELLRAGKEFYERAVAATDPAERGRLLLDATNKFEGALAINSESGIGKNYIGMISALSNQYDVAVRYLEEARNQSVPEGRIIDEIFRSRDELRIFEDRAHEVLVSSRIFQQQWDKAEGEIKHLIHDAAAKDDFKLRKHLLQYHYWHGLVLFFKSEEGPADELLLKEKAIEQFNKVVEIFNENGDQGVRENLVAYGEAILFRAIVLMKMNLYEQALVDICKVIDYSGGESGCDIENIYRRALIYFELGQIDKSLDEIEIFFDRYERSRKRDLPLAAYQLKSRIYLVKGDYDNAEAEIQKLMKDDDTGAWGNYLMGRCLAARGNFQGASKYLQKASLDEGPVSQSPQDRNFRKPFTPYSLHDIKKPPESWIYYFLGLCDLKTGQQQTIVEYFKKAVDKDPENYKACYQLGLAYLYSQVPQLNHAGKELRQASRVAVDVLSLNRQNPDAYYDISLAIAVVTMLQREGKDEAFGVEITSELNECIDFLPSRYEAYVFLYQNAFYDPSESGDQPNQAGISAIGRIANGVEKIRDPFGRDVLRFLAGDMDEQDFRKKYLSVTSGVDLRCPANYALFAKLTADPKRRRAAMKALEQCADSEAYGTIFFAAARFIQSQRNVVVY